MLEVLPLLVLALPVLQDPAPDGPEEPAGWSGTFDAGLTSFGGNSSSITGTINGKAKYEGLGWHAGAFVTYAGDRSKDPTTKQSSTKTRLYNGGGDYRRYFDETEEAFGYANAQYRRDVPNGLQNRTDGGVGGGYAFKWDDVASQISLEGGVSYVYENNVMAYATQEANARLAVTVDVKLVEDLNLVGKGAFLQSFQTAANRNFTGDLAIRYQVNGTIFLTAGGALAWDNTPGPGFGKTDWRVQIGIGASFGGGGG